MTVSCARLPEGARVLCLFADENPAPPGRIAAWLGGLWGTGGLLGGPEGLVREYANARTYAYLTRAVREVLDRSPGAYLGRTIVAPDLANGDPADAAPAVLCLDRDRPIQRAALRDALARPDWDLLLLVYPDALGLGARDLERLLGGTRRPVYVLNGRRRLFRRTGAMRLRLALGRFLTHSRGLESVLTLAAFGLGPLLGLWDSITKEASCPKK